MSWLFVFLGFSVLIVLHEAGHFFAAKAAGMRVEKFFLFFGPKLVSIKRGETEYGIAAIPIGGFVRISGMNPEEELPPEAEPRAYYRKPVWQRIVVTGAGPAVNIVLAFVILFFVAFGAPTVTDKVGEIEPGTPAAARLKPGDRLLAVDGKSFSGLGTTDRLERFREEIAAHECPAEKPTDGCRAATPVRLLIARGGERLVVGAYPTYDAALDRTRLGFSYGSESAHRDIGAAVSYAWDRIWFVSSGTFHVISHLFEAEQRKEISSPVGIGDVGHQAVDEGPLVAFFLLAIVSLSLGLINLLPILPLDGGHIFWALMEKLRGDPVPLRVMERATVVGIVLVVTLMFIGLSNDIGRITGEGFNLR